MLAETQARMGRIEDAESLLARCLELVPGFDAARHHYAMVLHRANKPVEALAEVDALLARIRERELPQPQAVVLCRTGDYDTAIASTTRCRTSIRTTRACGSVSAMR
jgi:predicted Zn-dependent protease